MRKNSLQPKISRRKFLGSSLAAAAFPLSAVARGFSAPSSSEKKQSFKLDYAPHFGMFSAHAGPNIIDQLKFMADMGFTALEDNGMMQRDRRIQELIAREMIRLQMRMGVFVAHADFGNPTFVKNDDVTRSMLMEQTRKAVEVAHRVNAKWMTVVPGAYNPRLAWEYQTANCIENLKWCAEICEKANVVMVLEPLNGLWDHPGLFLTKIPQAYQICRAVDSPSCKILNDLYHQQITEGNLIRNIDMAWSEIAYFQIGDNPGRKEPGTGEINFKNIFKHIYNKGYRGIVGMEHGNSKAGKEGELAVINAYVECDNF